MHTDFRGGCQCDFQYTCDQVDRDPYHWQNFVTLIPTLTLTLTRLHMPQMRAVLSYDAVTLQLYWCALHVQALANYLRAQAPAPIFKLQTPAVEHWKP